MMGFVARLNRHIRIAAEAGNLGAVHILTSLRNEWVSIQKRYNQEF